MTFVYLRTPLMLSVMNGHHGVAQILVEHGAQVDCADKNLHTALHAAVSGCNRCSFILAHKCGVIDLQYSG